MTAIEMDIVRRALALRKLRKIGVLWAEGSRYWISENEVDPWGSRVPVSFETLKTLVEQIESTIKLPPKRELPVVLFDVKLPHCG